MTEITDGSLDIVFGLIAVAAFIKFLPPIAAGLSIVWTLSRFYENWKQKTLAKNLCSKCKENIIFNDSEI